MSSPCPRRLAGGPGWVLALLLAPALMLSGCDREKRQFPQPPDGTADGQVQRQSPLQPAQAQQAQSRHANNAPPPEGLPPDYWEKYEGNGYAVSQGKRLYRWYNCNGCHAAGGGDIGPPLMDGKWRYGGEPQQIFATIKQGRPNGMPSFAGHITDDQLWQIVAYVRSMSGQLRIDVAPNRADALQAHEPESRREREPVAQEPPSGDPRQ